MGDEKSSPIYEFAQRYLKLQEATKKGPEYEQTHTAFAWWLAGLEQVHRICGPEDNPGYEVGKRNGQSLLTCTLTSLKSPRKMGITLSFRLQEDAEEFARALAEDTKEEYRVIIPADPKKH